MLDDNFIVSEIRNWEEFLSEEDKQIDITHLKLHINTGRPLGDRQFIERVEKLTGRVLHKQKPGPKIKNGN